MSKWYMLTVIGRDRPGIVARVTSALYQAGCNLGEASMLRLGGNFTIMLMVQAGDGADTLNKALAPVIEDLSLDCHVVGIDGSLHRHMEPDVRITVFGADRAGIVARVTTALAGAGLDILDLESDVAGSESEPVYVMHMEGRALNGVDPLQEALDALSEQGIETRITPVDTMMG
ncbi:MAG TPA: ACT domain-containing protein [Gammaproteobacteria bacterium]|nr:ACT domain-containing protein [Gammaproteobacteria bacterium]